MSPGSGLASRQMADHVDPWKLTLILLLLEDGRVVCSLKSADIGRLAGEVN